MRRRVAPRLGVQAKRQGEADYWAGFLGVRQHELPKPIIEAIFTGQGKIVQDAQIALRAKEAVVGKVNRRAFMSEYVERHLRGVVD